ncbi:MAG: hypothetical protein ACLR01_04280 [Vescimonas sp.]
MIFYAVLSLLLAVSPAGRLPHTVPILAGFLVLGVTYGMLMQAIGYGPRGPACSAPLPSAAARSMLPFLCWRRASIRWRCSC